jgi:hypothetical protein
MQHKKRIITGITLLILILLILSGCLGDENKKENGGGAYTLEVLPEVRISDNNYNESDMGNYFWEPPIWDKFCEAYANKYSEKLQATVILDMKRQAKELGEDPEILGECINASKESGVRLPCLAEKAQFDNNDVWIIVYAWGFDKEDLGHIRFFAIDMNTYEELHFQTCK